MFGAKELDLKNWKFTGERHYLWRGAVHGGVFVEGPHMYKHEGLHTLLETSALLLVTSALLVVTMFAIRNKCIGTRSKGHTCLNAIFLVTNRRLPLVGWRPSALGLEAIASRLEAIVSS